MLDGNGFFRTGQGTLSELSQVVERLVASRGCECNLQARVLAVPDSTSGWQLFAGRLRLLDGAPDPDIALALGPLRLVTSAISAAAASDPEQLRELLLSWLDPLGLR